MKHNLNFLKDTGIIETLLEIHTNGYTDRKDLAKRMNLSEKALYERMKKLKDNDLTNYFGTLTGKGKVIATHLNNMNFFLSRGKEEEYE